MQREFGYSAAQLSGAFSLARLISAVAGIGVGRYLDWRGPRALMTIGSIAGVLFVLAWSRVDGLVAFYALWAGIGLLMAAVLYEPASSCSPSGSRTLVTAAAVLRDPAVDERGFLRTLRRAGHRAPEGPDHPPVLHISSSPLPRSMTPASAWPG